MRADCIAAVAQAMGRELTAQEAKGIEDRIFGAMRRGAKADPQAWLAKPEAVRLQEAAQLARTELLAESALKKQRLELSVLAVSRLHQLRDDQDAAGVTGLKGLDRMIAFHADAKGQTMSIESTSKAIANDALRQMIGTLESSNPRWFGLFENKDGIRAIVKEIFGESTGVKEAAEGAKLWRDVSAALRQRFNASGGDVGLLDDWGMPHHHSQVRVAKAGAEAWLDDIMPRLNRERYVNADGTRMNDDQLNLFLHHAWETIATGGANKIEPGQPKGTGARANRGSESRQIHFKSADDYIEYQSKYGDRSLYEVLVGHVQGVSKDIALVETFGPNPDHVFRMLRDEAVRDAKMADKTKAGKIDQAAVTTENLYNLVSGKTLPVASEGLARSFDTLRNWLISSRLGSAVVSSMSDEATIYLTAHVNNLPAMRVFANELAALNKANPMEERMAMRAGLALDTMISSLNRFGNENLGASFSSRLANTTMRASGLNALTEARRRAFGVTMMSSLGSVVREHANLAALDATDNRILLSKGITETDFAVWKLATPEDWGGGNNTMLTADSIYRIPDAALADFGDPLKLKQQAATRLLGTVLEETDMAVITPGVKERELMLSGIQRGTWKGELARSFFLFKSFPISMITRHWSRGMSMPNTGGKAAYIATLMAATTVLGAATMQVKEMLAGKDPRNLNPLGEHGVKNWMKAMLQGGSLGIYGDFLFSENSQFGTSAIASFLGPVASLADDAIKLTQGNAMQAARGEDTHAGAELVRFIKGITPGANLWYAKAALDHLVFHQLQEYFSPGYLSNMRRRAQSEFGQQFWWEPGEISPERAPDMAATWAE